MQSTFIRCLILSIVCSLYTYAQSDTKPDEGTRRSKLEDIYRIQDTRTTHIGSLLSYLSDRDPVIRRQATLACGSIQDTTLIPLLISNLLDDDSTVQYAAAFAIGQTASGLCTKGKENLQHDLIWTRLAQIQSKRADIAGRMIEEIGKFGTKEGLNDLMLRYGSDAGIVNIPLVMSIARFGMRNVYQQNATLYLVSLAKRTDPVPWQVIYTLQRIGNNPDIRANVTDLTVLTRQQDPLVRMYTASLLGKIHDSSSSITPLMELAEFDTDWRVRVNAIKALGMFSLAGRNDVIDLFRRLFVDEQEYVGLTALEVLGNTDVSIEEGSALFEQLRSYSENVDDGYLWYFQTTSANTLARLIGRKAVQYIHLSSRQNHFIQSGLLRALGQTGDTTALPTIQTYLSNSHPLVVEAALSALNDLGQKNRSKQSVIDEIYSSLLQTVSYDDPAVSATAGELLADSLWLRGTSVKPLLGKLEQLSVPHDIDAMQIFCSTLGKLGDQRAVKPLEKLLNAPDRSVAMAAGSALEELTGKSYAQAIPQEFQPLYTDFDFPYLRALPDTVEVTIETTKGDIQLQLYKNIAPFTVMSFLKLASQKGFFQGLTFHRIVPNFVIQGGDPHGDGTGGPGYSIRSEFSPLTYTTGSLGMASSGKDTEGSQFFITQSPQPHLDGKYTLFGSVTAGMGTVNTLRVDDRILDVKVGK